MFYEILNENYQFSSVYSHGIGFNAISKKYGSRPALNIQLTKRQMQTIQLLKRVQHTHYIYVGRKKFLVSNRLTHVFQPILGFFFGLVSFHFSGKK